MSIRDEILRSVVIHYIEDETPIGSVQLQKDYELDISSATIRNYFKKLVLEGMLEQLHSSSGRIPTNEALVAFWINELKSDLVFKIRSFERVEESARKYGIFTLLHRDEEDSLLCVDSFKKEYIVLKFENCNVLIAYNSVVERFLNEFGNLGLKELLKISMQMGITELSDALMLSIRENSYINVNKQALIDIAHNNPVWSEKYFDSYANGDVAFLLHNGVNIDNTVPPGCVVGKQSCKVEDMDFTMTYMGESSRNFIGFLSSL